MDQVISRRDALKLLMVLLTANLLGIDVEAEAADGEPESDDMGEPFFAQGTLALWDDNQPREGICRMELAANPDGTGSIRIRHFAYSTFPPTGISELPLPAHTVRQLHALVFRVPPTYEEGIVVCPCCRADNWRGCPICSGTGAVEPWRAKSWRRGVDVDPTAA